MGRYNEISLDPIRILRFSRPGVDPKGDITDLLSRVRKGDQEASEALVRKTYSELKKIAQARLSSAGRHVLLDTTALVNEWYVRFAKAQGAQLNDRVHYFRYAAKVMRSVIVDLARNQGAARRGGGVEHISITSNIQGEDAGATEILQIHEALNALSALDARRAHIVELRYFVGMTETEIAEVLGLSERTVRRDWTKAKLFLADALG